jgi:hypothetical protein
MSEPRIMEIAWHDVDSYRTGETRHRYTATLLDASYHIRDLPNNAMEFAAWLSCLLQQIPLEWRDKATLSLSNGDCDECSSERAEFIMSVERTESDEEYSIRRAKEDEETTRKRLAAEQHERKTYERLKAKFQ